MERSEHIGKKPMAHFTIDWRGVDSPTKRKNPKPPIISKNASCTRRKNHALLAGSLEFKTH